MTAVGHETVWLNDVEGTSVMNRALIAFLDRLVERFTAILASVVSSRVESLRAEVQADQQSQLEDLARKYEADGKLSVAKSLRERALALTSANLASDAVNIVGAVSSDDPKLIAPESSDRQISRSADRGSQIQSLPDFSIPAHGRKKQRPTGGNDAADGSIPGAPA